MQAIACIHTRYIIAWLGEEKDHRVFQEVRLLLRKMKVTWVSFLVVGTSYIFPPGTARKSILIAISYINTTEIKLFLRI